jgi:hypothetical protein
MGDILVQFYKSNLAKWVVSNNDLDKIFFNEGWTWSPPIEGKFATWWEACFDPMVKQQLLTAQESFTAIAFRDEVSKDLREWDRGDHTQQLAGAILGKFRQLMSKLPGRKEFHLRTDDNDAFRKLYDGFIDRSRSVAEAILTRVESNFRKEPYDVILAKLEVARIADQDGRPANRDYWVDPGETPASYWSGKATLVAANLQKINQDLIEDLKALEDPAKFDQRPLAEQIQILKDLGKNYGEFRSGLRHLPRKIEGLGDPRIIGPVLAEAMRAVVAPGGGWQPAQPGGARAYSGPILSLTRTPDVLTLPAAEQTDYRRRLQELNTRRQRQNDALRKEMTRL